MRVRRAEYRVGRMREARDFVVIARDERLDEAAVEQFVCIRERRADAPVRMLDDVQFEREHDAMPHVVEPGDR
ncbi:hypothetical protein FEP57_05815 [Burkholderia multivorans]|nr:hypothetical protein [Burkholderia multivorans]